MDLFLIVAVLWTIVGLSHGLITVTSVITSSNGDVALVTELLSATESVHTTTITFNTNNVDKATVTTLVTKVVSTLEPTTSPHTITTPKLTTPVPSSTIKSPLTSQETSSSTATNQSTQSMTRVVSSIAGPATPQASGGVNGITKTGAQAHGSGGLSEGAKAGIGVGVAIAVIAVLVVVVLFYRSSSRQKTSATQDSENKEDQKVVTVSRWNSRKNFGAAWPFWKSELSGETARAELESPVPRVTSELSAEQELRWKNTARNLDETYEVHGDGNGNVSPQMARDLSTPPPIPFASKPRHSVGSP